MGHLTTWQHETTKRWYVKDYILVFGNATRGVINRRVYTTSTHRSLLVSFVVVAILQSLAA
jgi:hypothetical protein